jgi:uncharacterized protein with FMN-binding domain
MRKILYVILGFFTVMIAAIFIGIVYLQSGMSSTKSLTITSIDLSLVDDGIYEGTYENGRFTTTIEVTIVDHMITELVVIDDVTFANPDLTRALFDQIITSQDIDIDIIAGSTITTKAYLKAIENALKGGL